MKTRIRASEKASGAKSSSLPGTCAGSKVAIIMRSKNEQPHAERALESLLRQSFAGYVLYNVDSGSTDGSLEMLKRLSPFPENIVEIAPEEYIPGRVLNKMIGGTEAPIIVLLNADCIPLSENWLDMMLQPIIDNDADAITARQVARPDAHFIVKYDLERAYGNRNIAMNQDPFFSAAACAFKRSLWEQQKFPEEGWGEDLVWAVKCKRRGARFGIAVDAAVEHSHNYTLKTLYRREFGHGIVQYQMLNARPSFLRQGFACLKHIVRDILHALREAKSTTIPYNILYRLTFHRAHYRGRRAGLHRRGFPKKFFRD